MGFCLVLPQAGDAAPQHRVFIEGLSKTNDSDLRRELRRDLERSGSFEVVSSPAAADLILAGSTELYVRGYYSLYVRAGSAPSHGHPLYSGFSSVELKNRSGETVWSYLSTIREATGDPIRELSHDIAKHLLKANLPGSTTR